MNTTQSGRVDGRHARRERGRNAALDAMIDLVLEGHAPPSPELVSERAGVSVATLFRYFDTLPELHAEAGIRYLRRFEPLTEISDLGEGPLSSRISNLVDSRQQLFSKTAPIQQFGRKQASTITGVSSFFDDERLFFRDQITKHFAPELKAFKPATRADRLAIIVTTTSFESWQQLSQVFGFSPKQLKRAWTSALSDLLNPPS